VQLICNQQVVGSNPTESSLIEDAKMYLAILYYYIIMFILMANYKKSKQTLFCLNCGKELSKRQVKYCSCKCQKEHQQQDYIERWKNGEVSGIRGQYLLSSTIRNYLLKKHNYQCECCGWGKINKFTNTIPLEIHHKDGDYRNNSEENLQVLCPNCHSLTETIKSHNKSGRKGRQKYTK
jgi:Zn finger protein HypA/HybF involved in hydrogenase expression